MKKAHKPLTQAQRDALTQLTDACRLGVGSGLFERIDSEIYAPNHATPPTAEFRIALFEIRRRDDKENAE